MAENIDAQLLDRNTVSRQQEKQTAGSLRRHKRTGGQSSAEQGQSKPQSLRQQLKKGTADKTKQKAKAKVVSPVRMGTDRMLRQAWLYFIPSFGLSLVYIYLHVFMHFILPDLFCGPGEEWTFLDENFKEIGGGLKSSAGAKIAEWGLLLFITIILGMAILSALGLLYIIVHFITNPLEAIWDALKGLGTMLKFLVDIL